MKTNPVNLDTVEKDEQAAENALAPLQIKREATIIKLNFDKRECTFEISVDDKTIKESCRYFDDEPLEADLIRLRMQPAILYVNLLHWPDEIIFKVEEKKEDSLFEEKSNFPAVIEE